MITWLTSRKENKKSNYLHEERWKQMGSVSMLQENLTCQPIILKRRYLLNQTSLTLCSSWITINSITTTYWTRSGVCRLRIAIDRAYVKHMNSCKEGPLASVEGIFEGFRQPAIGSSCWTYRFCGRLCCISSFSGLFHFCSSFCSSRAYRWGSNQVQIWIRIMSLSHVRIL